jgi:pimeloyl-ACP methyl ester carboxylesterase
MSSGYADRFATVNGIKLHYQEWESRPGAATLLMVHGITMQSHAFDPAARLFDGRLRCIALDLRGHGESDRSAQGRYAYADYASDVVALLDALVLEKVHYLGTSLGGRVAMALSVEHAHRLASLAINDISPESTATGLARIVSVFGGDRPPFATVEAFVEEVLYVYAPRLKTLPMETLASSARWSLRAVDGGFRPKFDPRALSALAAANLQEDNSRMLWNGFRKLDCPLLILRAEQSDILTSEALRRMREAQPRAQAVEVPGVGHAPALIEPEAQRALTAFFG